MNKKTAAHDVRVKRYDGIHVPSVAQIKKEMLNAFEKKGMTPPKDLRDLAIHIPTKN